MNKVQKFRRRAAASVGAASAVVMGAASATTPAIDTSSILTAITDGQVAAVAVAIAFGVAVWVVRGAKMIRRA